MKEKRITALQRAKGPDLEPFIRARAWRLLGATWKKWIEVWVDPLTGDLVMRYE